jgi:hypothetical protein
MVNMSWLMNRDKNKISNTDEADGSGDNYNGLIKIWELAAHNPIILEGIIYDVSYLEGLIIENKELEGIIDTHNG